MIIEAMSLLLAQLNQYIHQADGNPLGTTDPVIIGNISQLDNASIATDLENKVVLSLVNVEEEATLKNTSHIKRAASGAVSYQNPPIYLNLSILFAATYSNYATALTRLSQVLSFFQSKNNFTLSNSPGIVNSIAPVRELSVTLDLLSLSFEEVNYLWGSLGGKQMPFAMYRARLVQIQDQRLLDSGAKIEDLTIRGRGKMA